MAPNKANMKMETTVEHIHSGTGVHRTDVITRKYALSCSEYQDELFYKSEEKLFILSGEK